MELRSRSGEEYWSFLEEHCSGDSELRSLVLRMIDNTADTKTRQTPLEPFPAGRVPLPRDSQLGPYRLIREVGSGGMGVVYEAADTRLGRKVAIKFLSQSTAVDDRRQERFLREARVASSLDHPNICTVYDIGQTPEGHPFIVMAYYEGETLDKILHRGPLSIEQARDTAVQLARGLERAHAAGITHRDVKPANVIVSKDGTAKLLDFGLAKLTGAISLTRTGGMPGTLAYMSPEQVRGESDVDTRADVFAFGAVLYEMLSGRRPFHGDGIPDLMRAITKEEAEPITKLRGDVPTSLAAVVTRALIKDRGQRYQNFTEVLADLGVGVPSEQVPRITERRLAPWLVGALTLSVVAAAAWFVSNRTPSEIAGVTDVGKVLPSAAKRPSLAVLRFQNLTSDADLAWLRNGLTELLVTELSQSPEIIVTSTSRLHESLKDHRILEEPSPSLDQIREVARDVEAGTVIRGSYARVGSLFRIAVTIEDAESGEILESEQVDGEGEESLFSLIDQLAAVIRGSYAISRPSASPPTIAAATTSSVEAWRLYSEGITLANDFKSSEATVLLERAVEIDPTFALGLANLGGIHSTLGHDNLAADYMGRALALSERLPIDERYRVEGIYYGAHWSTLTKAIAIYEDGLRVYPEMSAWRNNLARRYAFHERYEDAIREFERLIGDGSEFVGDYSDAANARAALGQMEVGYQYLSDLGARNGWFEQYVFGWYLTEWGRLDQAEEHLERSSALRPGEWTIPYALWRTAVLRGDWAQADARARQFASSAEPQARWRSAVSLARNALYRGNATQALDRLDNAAMTYGDPNAYTSLARCWKAEVLLEMGRPHQALQEARLAQPAGVGEFPELKAIFIAALAHEALGESSLADALARKLEETWEAHGRNRVEERQLFVLRGRLALARGDVDASVAAMRRAATLLPPKGVEFHWHVYPEHVQVWTALGEAELAAGRLEDAEAAFTRAAESGSEHLEQPVPFVRSLYFLGSIELQRGESPRARHYFQRFLTHWRDGELDPRRVAEAVSVVGG